MVIPFRALEHRGVFFCLVDCSFQPEQNPFRCLYNFSFPAPQESKNVTEDGVFIPSWRVPTQRKDCSNVDLIVESEKESRVRFIRVPVAVIPGEEGPSMDDAEDCSNSQMDEGEIAMARRLKIMAEKRKKKYGMASQVTGRNREKDSSGVVPACLPHSNLRKSVEAFDLRLHVDESLFSRKEQLDSQDELLRLRSGADRLVSPSVVLNIT